MRDVPHPQGRLVLGRKVRCFRVVVMLETVTCYRRSMHVASVRKSARREDAVVCIAAPTVASAHVGDRVDECRRDAVGEYRGDARRRV